MKKLNQPSHVTPLKYLFISIGIGISLLTLFGVIVAVYQSTDNRSEAAAKGKRCIVSAGKLNACPGTSVCVPLTSRSRVGRCQAPKVPAPKKCNMTVRPPRTCPAGYTCQTTSTLRGADGVCVAVGIPTPTQTPTPTPQPRDFSIGKLKIPPIISSGGKISVSVPVLETDGSQATDTEGFMVRMSIRPLFSRNELTTEYIPFVFDTQLWIARNVQMPVEPGFYRCTTQALCVSPASLCGQRYGMNTIKQTQQDIEIVSHPTITIKNTPTPTPTPNSQRICDTTKPASCPWGYVCMKIDTSTSNTGVCMLSSAPTNTPVPIPTIQPY